MSGGAVWLAVADAILTALLSLMVGMALFTLRRSSDRTTERDRMLHSMESDLRSLREGMSAGAREAIMHLNGRVNVLEDAYEQQAEHVANLRTDVRVAERELARLIGRPDDGGARRG